ncbi:hypothetical protein HanPI659440_Chr08g0279721 [Helianthus annuus]|nr:hypothetical protein HanPI659440_Chr08g0279721 [Helianthus annuus]
MGWKKCVIMLWLNMIRSINFKYYQPNSDVPNPLNMIRKLLVDHVRIITEILYIKRVILKRYRCLLHNQYLITIPFA